MLFSSYPFIFAFLPVVLIGFFLLAKQGLFRPALGFLTVSSLFFYGYWNPVYLILIMSSILVNYLLAIRIVDNHNNEAKHKHLLWLGLAFNIGLIGYFKYKNFFLDNLNEVFDLQLENVPVLLPLAISFFTFQQIAYLVDVYRDKQAERNFLNYALFISYFPQLIAGPIVHHRELLPQLRSQEIFKLNWMNIGAGLTIFSIGLFKKIMIADNLAPSVHAVFGMAEAGQDISLFVAWGGALAYTLQLYFDFSGYSDMAIGVALMFNIHLPVNFLSPYKSKSIIEFWRRWHITLSHFLRDYIYIPLGGNRAGEIKRMSNMMTTMLIGGLWHGAGWTFVLWGGLQGAYLVLNRMWIDFLAAIKLSFVRELPGYWFLAGCLTFFCVILGWVLFRAETLSGAMNLYHAMFSLDFVTLTPKYVDKVANVLPFMAITPDAAASNIMGLDEAKMIVAGLLIAFFLPNVREMFYLNKDKDKKWYRLVWKPSLFWVPVALVALCSSIMSMTNVSDFLYFQF